MIPIFTFAVGLYGLLDSSDNKYGIFILFIKIHRTLLFTAIYFIFYLKYLDFYSFDKK